MNLTKTHVIATLCTTNNFYPPTNDKVQVFRHTQDPSITIVHIPSSDKLHTLIKEDSIYLSELNLDMSAFSLGSFINQLQAINQAIIERQHALRT